MDSWELHDYRHPGDTLDDFPSIVITSEAQLRHRLAELRADEPGLHILVSPHRQQLHLGIGGPYGFLDWHDLDSGFGGPAVSPKDHGEEEFFLCEGIHEEIEGERLLAGEEVVEAVVDFYTHGELPNWMSWRIWDPRTKSWETRPARGNGLA